MAEKKIVMVTGLPRTGVNLVARIVELLGYPGPDPEANQYDERVAPVGRLIDADFVAGRVERAVPWVFATHGPLDAAAGKRLARIPELVVIECRRAGGDILASLRRSLAVTMPECDEERIATLADRHYRVWAHRLRFFLPLWEWPKLVVSLDGLIEKPRRAVRKIASFVGADPVDKAIKLVSPKLRR